MRRWTLALLVLAGCAVRAPATSQPAAGAAGLAALQGDITVATFWATWCGPCRKELPKLEVLHRKLKNDPSVRVVAISVDRKGKAEAARELAKELGTTIPVVTEGEPLYFRFFPKADDTDVPRLAIFDRQRHGYETLGLDPSQSTDEFVRGLEQAIAAVRSGTAPSIGRWQPLQAAAAE